LGRTPIRAKLVLDAEARSKLEVIAKSRTEGQARIERARVLLAYYAGERVTALAEAFQTNSPKIERILNRALAMGALASLEDRPGRVVSLRSRRKHVPGSWLSPARSPSTWATPKNSGQPGPWRSTPENTDLKPGISAWPCLGGAPSPSCSPAPSFGPTKSNTTWSGATPSSTQRWPRS